MISINVTSLVPAVNSTFNVSNTIEVSANVTASSGVDSVYANITFIDPSGTKNYFPRSEICSRRW